MRLLLLLSAILAALSGTGSAHATELRQVEATAAVLSTSATARVAQRSPAFLRDAPRGRQLMPAIVEPQALVVPAPTPLYRLRPRE